MDFKHLRRFISLAITTTMVLGQQFYAPTIAYGANISESETYESKSSSDFSNDILIIDENENSGAGSSSESAEYSSTSDSNDILIIADDELSSESSSEDDSAAEASSDSLLTLEDDEASLLATEVYPEDYYEVFPTGLRDEVIEVESVSDGFGLNNKYAGASTMRLQSSYLPKFYINTNLPVLRNQTPYGTCWAFATTALAEIYMMKNNPGLSADYSELHLAYFTYNTVVDPLGGLESDYFYQGASKATLNMGGNVDAGMNTFARWVGVADESTADYQDDIDTAISSGLDPSIAYDSVVRLKNFYYENVTTEKETIDAEKHQGIKQLVYKYGAASISYGALSSTSAAINSKVYDSKHYSYYNPSYIKHNHAVTIVGWDDNFPKENFSQTPPGDGAFLIRNSWADGKGTSIENNMGYNGYFWMSYYEPSFGAKSVAGEFEETGAYDNNYVYDGGYCNVATSDSKVANVFTAHAKGADNGEDIAAVSFETTNSNVNYEVKIYTDLEDVTDPESGHLEDIITGGTTYAGLYTLTPSTPIHVSKGDTFSVVVSLTKAGTTCGISKEFQYASDPAEVNAVSGQSYKYNSSSKRWEDAVLVNSAKNYAVKAYTTNALEDTVKAESIEIEGLDNNALSIAVSDSKKLNATVLPTTASNQKLVWSSSKKSVATVTQAGVISGKSVGTATITVAVDGTNVSRKINVTVIDKLLGLDISTSESVILEDHLYYLSCAPLPASHNTTGQVKWDTSTPELIDLNKDTGEFFTTSAGLASVTAELEGVTATIDFFIYPKYTYYVADDYTVTFTIKTSPSIGRYDLWRGDTPQNNPATPGNDEKEVTLTDAYYKGKNVDYGEFRLGFYTGETTYTLGISIPLAGYKNITYVLGDGFNDPQNPSRYKIGTSVPLYDAIPAKDRIFFDGWYLDKEYSPKSKRTRILSTDTESLTFYAKWKSAVTSVDIYSLENGMTTAAPSEIRTSYKITFTATVTTMDVEGVNTGFEWVNYGTDSSPVYAQLSPSGCAKVALDKNGNLTITPSSSGTVTISARSLEDPDFITTETITLKPYDVKYVLGTGKHNYRNPKFYFSGTTKNLYEAECTKEGYVFEGWYTDPGFPESSRKTSIEKTDAQDLTLYAHYIKWATDLTGISIYPVIDGVMSKETPLPDELLLDNGDLILTAQVEPEDAKNVDMGFSWNIGTETSPKFAEIKPARAAIVTVEADGNLRIHPEYPGLVTVTVKSVANESITMSKSFAIREILPQSIKISVDSSSPDVNETAKFGIDSRYVTDVKETPDSPIFMDSAENLKSSLKLTCSLYTVKNPTDESTLARNQAVLFTSSNDGILAITETGNDIITDENGNTYVKNYVIVSPGPNVEELLNDNEKEYVTARLAAISIANSAVYIESNIVIRKTEFTEDIISDVIPELRIISSDKDQKIYASSFSATPVDEDGIILSTGKSETVKVQFIPEVENTTVLWSSANAAIATVNATGTITAKSAGEVVITARAPESGLSAAVRVKVFDPVTSLTLDKTTIKLGVGQTAVLNVATILPTTANNEVTFVSNHDGSDGRASICEVVSNDKHSAIIRGVSSGTAVITVRSSNGEKTAKCTVNVGNSVEDIVIFSRNKANEVAAGKTLQFYSIFNNGDNSNQPINKTLTWVIKDESPSGVATINANGLLTAKKEGWVNLVARSTTDMNPDGSYIESNPVRVWVYVPLQKAILNIETLTISPEKKEQERLGTTISRTPPGKCFTLEALLTPTVLGANDGDTVTGKEINSDVRDSIKWKLKNPSQEGYLEFWDEENEIFTSKGTTDGSFTGKSLTLRAYPYLEITSNVVIPVIATFKPYNDIKETTLTCNVTITSGYLSKITLSPSKLSMNRGADADITATLTPILPLDSSLHWEIADDESRDLICFVDKDTGEDGFYETDTRDINGSGNNSVRIRAIVNDNETTKTKATILVTARGTDSYGNKLTTNGKPKTVKLVVNIGNQAHDVMLTSSKLNVSWDNAAADNTTNDGKLLKLYTGKATTLKAAVFTKYGSINGAAAKAKNQSSTWTVPANSVKAGSQKVIWSSSDTSVATVNASGNVKAVGTGIAFITAQSVDKSYSADGKSSSSNATATAMVYVYDSATQVTLDKSKSPLCLEVSSEASAASFRQYDIVTPSITPDSVFDNPRVDEQFKNLVSPKDIQAVEEMNLITWTVSSGTAEKPLIAVTSVETSKIIAAKSISDKQARLADYDSEYTPLAKQNSFTTQKGESLAIKALRPGIIKLTATAAGGKKASCTLTIYTHVQDVNLKLAWADGSDNTPGSYTAPVKKSVTIGKEKTQLTILAKSENSDYAYEAHMSMKYAKTLNLSTVLDYYAGLGEIATYSDKKTTAEKALTDLYTSTKKYAVDNGINYSSSDSSVVTVSNKGGLTAKKPGTAVITISTVDGEKTKEIKVTVE